jgi:hypothetical protein
LVWCVGKTPLEHLYELVPIARNPKEGRDGDDLLLKMRVADSQRQQLVGNSEEFGHPSNYRSEQFARTSAFEAALRSGTELVGTSVACA